MSNFDLPEELILNILFRLSIKFELRCKSVCKLWYKLIEDPHFAYNHSMKIKNPDTDDFILECCTVSTNPIVETMMYGFLPLLLQQDTSLDNNYVWKNCKKPESWFSSGFLPVSCSCNGLICQQVDKEMKFRIMNPLYSVLDVIDVEPPREPRMILAFGLGLDELSRRFKVACFVRDEAKRHSSVSLLVYELGGSSTSWRKLRELYVYFCNGKSPVFLDGCIHWLGGIRDGNVIQISIVSFNVSTEALEAQTFPPEFVSSFRRGASPCLFDFNGSLGLVLDQRANVEVWVLCRDGNEVDTTKKWIKRFCISRPSWTGHVERVVLFEGCEMLMKNNKGKYVKYNTQTGITTLLPELPNGVGLFMCHRGSLVRPSDLPALML